MDKRLMPTELSPLQIYLLCDIENSTYKERELLLSAYKYDRKKDMYYLQCSNITKEMLNIVYRKKGLLGG